MVTSLNRLASTSDFVAHVEAPNPEHHHEAIDLGKDHDPAMAVRDQD